MERKEGGNLTYVEVKKDIECAKEWEERGREGERRRCGHEIGRKEVEEEGEARLRKGGKEEDRNEGKEDGNEGNEREMKGERKEGNGEGKRKLSKGGWEEGNGR